jgi:hypothetical protein
MKSYLYAVQRESGHEVVSATVEVKKVGDVEAQHMPNGLVRLVHDGEVVATGDSVVDEGEKLSLHRWPADDKLSEPVSKPVKAPEPDSE